MLLGALQGSTKNIKRITKTSGQFHLLLQLNTKEEVKEIPKSSALIARLSQNSIHNLTVTKFSHIKFPEN